MGEDVEEEEGVVLQDDGCPAVIVEEVPSAQVEECYSAQVLVYDDETYLMQDVAEEQEVVTEVAETGKDFVQFIWKYYRMISSKERLLGNFSSYNAHFLPSFLPAVFLFLFKAYQNNVMYNVLYIPVREVGKIHNCVQNGKAVTFTASFVVQVKHLTAVIFVT